MTDKPSNYTTEPESTDPNELAAISFNEKGVPTIAEANFKVQQIALDYLQFGDDVAEIQRQHPMLTKAQILAAISYYLAHKESFDTEIEESLREYEKLHRDSANSPIRRRIRAWRELR